MIPCSIFPKITKMSNRILFSDFYTYNKTQRTILYLSVSDTANTMVELDYSVPYPNPTANTSSTFINKNLQIILELFLSSVKEFW